jgi:hypothetical protein
MQVIPCQINKRMVATAFFILLKLCLFIGCYDILSFLSGLRLSPLGTAATTDLLYQPQMIDDGDCGAIGGMKIGKGK